MRGHLSEKREERTERERIHVSPKGNSKGVPASPSIGFKVPPLSNPINASLTYCTALFPSHHHQSAIFGRFVSLAPPLPTRCLASLRPLSPLFSLSQTALQYQSKVYSTIQQYILLRVHINIHTLILLV